MISFDEIGLSPSMILKLVVLGGISFLFFFIGMMQGQESVMLLTGVLSLAVNFGMSYAFARYRTLRAGIVGSFAYSSAPLIMLFVTAVEFVQGAPSGPVLILLAMSLLTLSSGWGGVYYWIQSRPK